MDKLLTIVIPTYNMEAFLCKCLTSLIVDRMELMELVEVLVVIDGAKDKSSEIAHSFENKYPSLFKVIDKENGNYGSCVNKGLEVAKGKYIKVLDADDSFDTNAFEKYLECLKSTDADMIVSSGMNVDLQDKVTLTWNFCYISGRLYSIEDLEHVWIHDVTHKTSILRSINYRQTEGISYTDEEWVFYPMFEVKNFLAIDLKLYKYTVGRDGQTMNSANWAKSIGNEITVSKGMYEFLKEKNWEVGRSKRYIEKKMNDRIRGFYQRALITCRLYNNQELRDFDIYLKSSCLNVYTYSDSLLAPNKRFEFYFVRYWRSQNCSISSSWNKFTLYNWWMKLKTWK